MGTYESISDIFIPYDNFDVDGLQGVFQNLWHVSIYIAAVYLVIVYSSERVIKRKYNIKGVLAVWNGSLAIFSFYGVLNVTRQLYSDLLTYGFDKTVCWERYYYSSKPLGYWLYLFCLSKFPELFDTAFIVLRKAPIQILHTYHHASVLIFAWHILAYGPAASYWYAGMNYVVHAIMYSYYCIRALNVRVPQMLAKCITSMQSLQMLVGFGVNFYSIYRKYNGHECGNTYAHSFIAIALYFSYFILFLRFACQRYGALPKPKAA